MEGFTKVETRMLPLTVLKHLPEVNPRDESKLNAKSMENLLVKWESVKESSPIAVFELDGQFVVADGIHRVKTAGKLKETEIKSDIFEGNMLDACRFAAVANAYHGTAYDQVARDRMITNLAEQGMDRMEITVTMGLQTRTAPRGHELPSNAVNDALWAEEVALVVGAERRLHLSKSALNAIRVFPREEWEELADKAIEEGLSHHEIREGRVAKVTLTLNIKQQTGTADVRHGNSVDGYRIEKAPVFKFTRIGPNIDKLIKAYGPEVTPADLEDAIERLTTKIAKLEAQNA